MTSVRKPYSYMTKDSVFVKFFSRMGLGSNKEHCRPNIFTFSPDWNRKDETRQIRWWRKRDIAILSRERFFVWLERNFLMDIRAPSFHFLSTVKFSLICKLGFQLPDLCLGPYFFRHDDLSQKGQFELRLWRYQYITHSLLLPLQPYFLCDRTRTVP